VTRVTIFKETITAVCQSCYCLLLFS